MLDAVLKKFYLMNHHFAPCFDCWRDTAVATDTEAKPTMAHAYAQVGRIQLRDEPVTLEDL
jgi:hypothetical protein